MANLNFPDLNKASRLFVPNRSASLAALFGVGLVIGSLPGVVEALPSPSRNPRINEGNILAFVDAASGSVNQQVEDFSFVKEPVIVGDRVVGVGDVGGRLALLEGTPGEGNTFYFVEKGAVNNENIHYLAVAPKNKGRIAILSDSGFYFSDNNWQTNANFGNPGVVSHYVESVRFSDDGRLVFMDIEREGQRHTAIFNPEAIPNFQFLEGSNSAIRSSLPSTPRLQPEGTYADYRMEKIGNGWKLRKHTYDLSMGQEIIEDTPLGFRFNEGLVQILGDYMTIRGGLRIGLIGLWVLSDETRRVEITSYYEVNPERGEILYSTSPEPGLYPLDSRAQESVLAVNGKAEDPSSGDKYLSVFYSGLDGNGEHIQGYGIEYSSNSSLQMHARVHWPETDPIDYLGILDAGEDNQYLVALTDGNLRTLRMGNDTREEWKEPHLLLD